MRHELIVKARADWWPWVALLCAAPLLFLLPITHDAIWQIWLGRQMLGGAELYRDLIEVNPPLWFWIGEILAIPGADPRLTIVGFFLAATAAIAIAPPAAFCFGDALTAAPARAGDVSCPANVGSFGYSAGREAWPYLKRS